MSELKTITCVKCRIEMSIRQFVGHREGKGAPCSRVPCSVCGVPVGNDGEIAHGQAVCSKICRRNVPEPKTRRDEVRRVNDQLSAMRRAERLPGVYQRAARAS